MGAKRVFSLTNPSKRERRADAASPGKDDVILLKLRSPPSHLPTSSDPAMATVELRYLAEDN